MAKETLVKLHKHFTFLSKGEFSAADFNKEYGEGEDGGFSHMGRLTSDRIQLIVANAKRNLLEMEEKHPFLKESKPEAKTDKSKKKGD